jgi:hypothetical protein
MSRQFSTRRSDLFGLIGWVGLNIRSGQFHDRWGKSMPRNLEKQFQAELTQRQQQTKQTKHENLRSQWHQWRLILGYLTGTVMIVGLATNGLFNLANPRSPSANIPETLKPNPDSTLTQILHLSHEGIANRVEIWEKGRNNTFDGRLCKPSRNTPNC